MSNKDVIQKIYAAFGRGDFETIVGTVAEDVKWIVQGPDTLAYCGTFVGREGVRRWVDALMRSVKVDKFEPKQFFTDGDHVISLCDFAATSTATGKSYTTRLAHVWQVADNAVVRFEDFLDTAAAAAVTAR